MAQDNNKAAEATADAVDAGAEAARETTKQATATTARASKRVAKAAETATKKNSRRAKASRASAKASRTKAKTKARRSARKPETAAANERTNEMNFNPTSLFAGFGAFPAGPFQSMFAQAGERGEEAAKRSQEAGEELTDITRANVEAIVEAAQIAAEGARSIGEEFVESSRESIEQAANAARVMAEAKSSTEFVQLQAEFARTSFDRMVTESSRLTESFVKLAGEAFQPISNRASTNAERLNTFVA